MDFADQGLYKQSGKQPASMRNGRTMRSAP
jgi:hypothetical protein